MDNDFESELPTDVSGTLPNGIPNRKMPAWRSDDETAKSALPSQDLPSGSVLVTGDAAADKARYNDSFTIDYNHDPD